MLCWLSCFDLDLCLQGVCFVHRVYSPLGIALLLLLSSITFCKMKSWSRNLLLVCKHAYCVIVPM
jgi:hypothetical protein